MDDLLKIWNENILNLLEEDISYHHLDEGLVKYAKGRYTIGLNSYSEKLAAMDVNIDGNIIDIGCGACNWTIAAAAKISESYCVYGVDPNNSFIKFGNVIKQNNNINNVRFINGEGEDNKNYVECSLVLTNGSLMFAYAHNVIDCIYTHLNGGGRVYGNYTTSAGRLARLIPAIKQSNNSHIKAALLPIYNSAMMQIGLCPKKGSFAFNSDNLMKLFKVSGLNIISKPNVHDWSPTIALYGIVDFLLEKPKSTNDITGIDNIPVKELFNAGAHGIVCKKNHATYGESDRSFIARSMIANRDGKNAEKLIKGINEMDISRIILITQYFLDGINKDYKLLHDIEVHKEDKFIKYFCMGCIELRMRKYEYAVEYFNKTIIHNAEWIGGWVGMLISMLDNKLNEYDEFIVKICEMIEVADTGIVIDDRKIKKAFSDLVK